LITVSDLDDGFIQYKEFRDYFGDDLLTGDAAPSELSSLFKEIDHDQSGSITVEQLLSFFNRHSVMVTEEEARVFLGMVSDAGNDNSISFKGKP
jgi:Ca2+-binding EF-hand superfamily protein